MRRRAGQDLRRDRRCPFLGAEAEGLFTLFGILFFLISVTMVGIGLIGE